MKETQQQVRFIVAAKNLMGDKPNGWVYLVSKSRGAFCNWTTQIENARTFDRVKQARHEVGKANNSGLVHWAFMIAVPSGMDVTALGEVML